LLVARVVEAMKISLVILGKTRRAELRSLLEDYLGRLRQYAKIETIELRGSASARLRKLPSGPGSTWVLLDAGGIQFTSAQFARWLGELRDRGTRELLFLCGDAEGFPENLREKAHTQLSLSPLTLPHELARVVLAEQLYRAFALLAGHPYPK
jgi:23S rRNA (pseudouridine1915-N3)-methyltransferase